MKGDRLTDGTVDEVHVSIGERDPLFARLWKPKAAPVNGVVVVVHGLGEHGGRYHQLAAELASAGWASLAVDLPGHGRSPGRRGHVRSYVGVLRDIEAVRVKASELLPNVPQVLLGHSMGGNLATNYVLRAGEWHASSPPLQGLILSGPMFLPTQPPSRPQIFAAWLTGYVLPWYTIKAPVDVTKLTHNADAVADLKQDKLNHRRISLYLATQLLAQGRYALDHAARLSIPALVMHGVEDPITSFRASESFCLRAGDHVTFKPFPGMLHEIFHESDPMPVYHVIRNWLEQTIKQPGTPA